MVSYPSNCCHSNSLVFPSFFFLVFIFYLLSITHSSILTLSLSSTSLFLTFFVDILYVFSCLFLGFLPPFVGSLLTVSVPIVDYQYHHGFHASSDYEGSSVCILFLCLIVSSDVANIGTSYEKPESHSIVDVPLPELRDNDVLVCLSLLFHTYTYHIPLTFLPFPHRSKSRPAVSAEPTCTSTRVNSSQRYRNAPTLPQPLSHPTNKGI